MSRTEGVLCMVAIFVALAGIILYAGRGAR